MGKGRSATKTRPQKKSKARRPAAPRGAEREASSTPQTPAAERKPFAAPSAEGLIKGACTVRASTAADAPAIAALWKELSRSQSLFGEEWAIVEGSAERYAKGAAAAAGNPRSIYLVAEIDIGSPSHGGRWQLVGFIHATVRLRNSAFEHSVVGEISAISVAPDATGRGVGAALVAAAMDWLSRRGITRVEATAPASNIAARAFLQNQGFRDSATVVWAEVPQTIGTPIYSTDS